MVDDSKYIIVPNTSQPGTFANPAGDELARLVLEGYRIIAKQSCRDVCHYILIKFKPGTKPKDRDVIPLRSGVDPSTIPTLAEDI
jgi:hypothetical protein